MTTETVNPGGSPKITSASRQRIREASLEVREGQDPSQVEYTRFELLMKRILKVSKKEIDARREAERKRT